MNRSRRDFLLLAGAPLLALSAAPQAGHALAAGKGRVVRWAMLVDTRRLDEQAIERMARACHKAHNVPDMPGRQEVKWLWGAEVRHAFPESCHSALPHALQTRAIPLLCNHCANPPCVRVCPAGATFKRADGLVGMDPHRCIGCRCCMAACPYGARSFNFCDPAPYVSDPVPGYPMRERGVVEKCTFCAERLAEGLQPACVEASGGAVLFGDISDPASAISQALAKSLTLRRKAHLGTEPQVYYIL